MAAMTSDIASPLVLICLVPLLYGLHNSSFKVTALGGFLFGVIAYSFVPLALLKWGWDVTGYSVLMIGAFFSAFALLTKALSRLPVLGSVMVALPLAYGVMQLLGERFLAMPVLLAVAWPNELAAGSHWFSVLGGHGVDTVICTVNALLATLFLDVNRLVVLGTLVSVCVVIGVMLIAFDTGTNTPAIPAAESGLDIITVDNAMSYDRVRQVPYSLAERAKITREMNALTRQAIARQPDLILWPEGGNGLAIRQIVSQRQALRDLNAYGDYQLIAGSKQYGAKGREYNVAHHIVDGAFVKTSYKQHRVPVLESELGDGKNALFTINGYSLGVGICFDIAFPHTVDRLVEGGADALVVLSNDASFGYSLLSFIHLRYAAIRAMEQARSVLFFSNTGPAVVIDATGRILSGYFHTAEARLEIHKLLTSSRDTLYSRYENGIRAGMILLVTALLWSVHRLCPQR